uniref:CCHC-type domain-containing protein n=1 Tax=Peronospora matthiolae TaxID=2874970 RepID=A0AAV1UI68_9STRA
MRDARGGSDSLVLDNIVHHASPELIDVMMAKYDSTRPYYMRHVEELAQIAQSIQHGSGAVGREVIAEHVDARPEKRTCLTCGEVGHVQRNFRAKDTVVDEEHGESS